MAQEYHPDKIPASPAWLRQEAEERFKQINEAHEVLMDSQKRKEYDEALKQLRSRAAGRDAPSRKSSGPSAASSYSQGGVWTSFKFKSGEASSIADLINLCDRYWDEAADYLCNGYFERWLVAALGEGTLAKQARGIVASFAGEKRKALEMFVRDMCRRIGANPGPQLVCEPSEIDFGRKELGTKHSLALRIKNVGRGYAWGAVSIEPVLPGVSGPASFEGWDSEIGIRLDTTGVSAGLYQGSVMIRIEGTETPVTVALHYRVVPRAWSYVLGWTAGLGVAVGIGMWVCRSVLANSAPQLSGWLLSYVDPLPSDVMWATGVVGVAVVGAIVLLFKGRLKASSDS